MNYLVACFFLAFFALSLGGKHSFSPLRVWLAMWAVSWSVNAVLGYGYYFSPIVVLINILGVSAYAVGAGFFWSLLNSSGGLTHNHGSQFAVALQKNRVAPLLITVLLLSCVLLIDLGMRKFSSSNLFQFIMYDRSRLFDVMKENQAALYQDNELNFPIEFKIVTLIICFSAVICTYGLSFEKIRKIDILNTLLLASISLLFSATASVRSLILVPIIIGGFSFFAGCVVNGRSYVLVSKKTILGGIFTVFSFAIWVLIVQSARMGDADLSRIGATLDHMRPWLSGYIPALSVWFDSLSNADLGWGGNFFRAILGPLGLAEGEGFDSRMMAVPIGNWQTSNAMTIFRVLISDFGAVGAVLFCFVLGFFGEYFYNKAMNRQGAWTVILVAQYCYVFFSINYWFFFYGSRVFGFVLAAVVFGYIAHKSRIPNSASGMASHSAHFHAR